MLFKRLYDVLVKKIKAIQTNDTSNIVKKNYDTKIKENDDKIHNKYITTNYFNKFSGAVFDEKIKTIKISNN